MCKKYLITFGGPTNNYHDAVNRICSQAKEFNTFDTIIAYTEEDLKNDKDFWDKNGDFLEKNKRGYGYWIWKPYIILKTLKTINEGDILLYLDCGCELNIFGKDLLFDFFEKVKTKLIIGTSAGSNDIIFTKNDLIEFCDMRDNAKLGDPHMQTTILMILKCNTMCNLFTEFYEIASNNYNLIDDSPSITKNNKKFIEHRHDQSIFNMLVKKYNLINYDMDPTCFGYYPYNANNYYTKGLKFPIWSCRNRSGIPLLKHKTI